jgi:TPR repeat protein
MSGWRAKFYLTIAVIVVAASGLANGAAFAAARVALLIGNQNYQATAALRNPANDVELMRKTLLAAGFDDVEVAVDLDLVDMRKALRNFEDKADGADVAVLYYSGHGLEMDGQNYLIPVDAQLKSDRDVEDETVPMDRAERALSGATKLKLVILDACRNNPFVDTMTRSVGSRSIVRGLAKVEPDGADTLVAYASRAGTVALDGAGANSPFAMALAKYIAQPGVDVRIALGQVRDDVFKVTEHKQEPFVYGSLGGAQIFISIKQLNLTVNNPVKEDKKEDVAPNGISSAAADWQNIKDLADKELLEAFIAKHGDDPVYKMLAEKKIKLLAEAEAKSNVEADQIAWDALKGSTDAAALQRFIERYPESQYRKDAEAAVAMLRPAENPATPDSKDTPASRDCYLLAGEPQSLEGFAGVYLPKIDAKRALTACAQAVNENPTDGMLIDLLGRAHEADHNYAEAHRNYQKAADLGNMFGLTNLAWLSVYGLDGPADVEKGRQMFEKGAIAGNHYAQASLAFLYRDGYGGIKQDSAEAIKWYEKSAAQGNANALGNLGWFYREGVGVAQDYQKSIDYYRKGADAGDLSSIAAMGYAAQNGLGIPQNYDEARKWYEKGANAGDAYSMASLAFLYDGGIGVKQDYVEARYWYEKAADAGSAYAMGNLSRLYDQGLGTPVDATEAVRWAVAAVERGDSGKKEELKTSPENFSAAFRRAFQQTLKDRGYFKGEVNGDFGADTLTAIDSLAAGKVVNTDTSNTNNTNNTSNSGIAGTSTTTTTTTTSANPDNVVFKPNAKSETDSARQCYAIASEPGSAPDFNGIPMASDMVSTAVEICTKAANEDPGDSMLWDMIGRADDVGRNFDDARRNYQKAIDLGNVWAYTNLAWMAIYGNGETLDVAKGMKMLQKAADTGNAYAETSLGWMYREGYGGIAQDYKLSLDWYTKAAEQEYPNAQASVGWFYREGKGVAVDYVKSLDSYTKAAAHGDINAIGAMGYAAQNGLGMDVDFGAAKSWYEKGLVREDAYSISALAWLYREGKGVPQDYAKALELYRRAAAMSDVTAISSLGYMAQYGLGMTIDYAAAVQWYEKAAAENDAYSLSSLGWMYREGVGVTRDYAKSLDYYKRGADLSDLNSMGSLGYALQNGLGTPVNMEEARSWFEKAAQLGDTYSMASLAWLIENGQGGEKDYAQAKDWYQKAADGGNTYAMGNLSWLYDQGLGTQTDAVEAARLAAAAIAGGETTFINDMKAGAANYSADFRKQLQKQLKDKGFYTGPLDGVFGATTTNAIDRMSQSRS